MEAKKQFIEFRMPLDIADKQDAGFQIQAIYERRHNLTLAEVQEIFCQQIMDKKHAQTLGWTSYEQFYMYSDLSHECVFLAEYPNDISKELSLSMAVKEAENALGNPTSNIIIEIENLQNKLNDISERLSKLKQLLKEEKEKNK